MRMEDINLESNNLVAAARTKLTKLAHDFKATLYSKMGRSLKGIKTHSNVIDKVLLRDSSFTVYENRLEEEFYGCSVRVSFSHPKTYLYVLKDIWVIGSEGHIFFEPDTLFSVCPSTMSIEPQKIRRPIKLLSQTIEEPVFILSNRAPGNRGHFLVEHLPRLLVSLDVIQDLGGCKILVTPGHREWQVDYLERLGVPASDIIEASFGSVFCKKAFYVPVLYEGGRATISCEDDYHLIRKRFIFDQKSSWKSAPVFLSRKDAPGRRLVNEDAIFEIARRYFPEMKKIALSGLSLDEQIRLFQHAPVVMGPHGQPFRNLLFCNRAISVQLLQGFRSPSNEYYHWAQNYNCLGIMSGNRCMSLFNEIEFYENSDWIYPEDKFEKDMSQLISLLNKEKAVVYEV